MDYEQELKLENLLKIKDLNSKKWKRLYLASRDGFKASDFHSKCNYSENTLTLVKAESGNIFGGYASVNWSYYSSNSKSDTNAFIFSLENKENKPLLFKLANNNGYSIYCSSSCGPIFGSGRYDLSIADCSNENEKSFSDLGNVYIHQEYLKGTEKAKTLLAGSHYFKVNEIEVYQKQ